VKSDFSKDGIVNKHLRRNWK